MGVFVIKKSIPGATKLYIFLKNKSACVLYSFPYVFLFVGENVPAYHFKDNILPLIKSKGRLKFNQDVALNYVIENRKSPRKLPYKLFG